MKKSNLPQMYFIVARQFIKSCVSVKKGLWALYKTRLCTPSITCQGASLSHQCRGQGTFECNPGIEVTAQSIQLHRKREIEIEAERRTGRTLRAFTGFVQSSWLIQINTMGKWMETGTKKNLNDTDQLVFWQIRPVRCPNLSFLKDQQIVFTFYSDCKQTLRKKVFFIFYFFC